MGIFEGEIGFDQKVGSGIESFRPQGANVWRVALIPKVRKVADLTPEQIETLQGLVPTKLAEEYTLGGEKCWLHWTTIGAKVHWFESIKRSVVCNSKPGEPPAACCKHDTSTNGASYYFVLPIYKYATAADGSFVNNDPKTAFQGGKLLAWKLSEAKFKQIHATNEAAFISDHDLRVEGEPRGDFTIVQIRNFREALWRQNPEIMDKLLVKAEEVWQFAPRRVGAVMTDIDLEEKLGVRKPDVPGTADFDDSILSV